MRYPTFNRDSKDFRVRYNRGNDNSVDNSTEDPISVSIMDVDTAIMKYLQNTIKPTLTQGGKQIQVPVIYGSPERWKSAQQDGYIRDKNGKLMLPIIMVHRTDMVENAINSPVNKYQKYVYKGGWNRRNVYDRFAVVNNVIPSEVLHVSIVPDYYNITYQAIMWTEYVEQMNHLVETISFESNEYWGEDNNYKFIAKIAQFQQSTEVPANDDRLVKNSFTIEVKAYILPKSALDKQGKRASTSRIDYSPKKVVFDTEFVVDPSYKEYYSAPEITYTSGSPTP